MYIITCNIIYHVVIGSVLQWLGVCVYGYEFGRFPVSELRGKFCERFFYRGPFLVFRVAFTFHGVSFLRNSFLYVIISFDTLHASILSKHAQHKRQNIKYRYGSFLFLVCESLFLSYILYASIPLYQFVYLLLLKIKVY